MCIDTHTHAARVIGTVSTKDFFSRRCAARADARAEVSPLPEERREKSIFDGAGDRAVDRAAELRPRVPPRLHRLGLQPEG